MFTTNPPTNITMKAHIEMPSSNMSPRKRKIEEEETINASLANVKEQQKKKTRFEEKEENIRFSDRQEEREILERIEADIAAQERRSDQYCADIKKRSCSESKKEEAKVATPEEQKEIPNPPTAATMNSAIQLPSTASSSEFNPPRSPESFARTRTSKISKNKHSSPQSTTQPKQHHFVLRTLDASLLFWLPLVGLMHELTVLLHWMISILSISTQIITKSARKSKLLYKVGIAIAIAYSTLPAAKNTSVARDTTTCVYVPGAGFSGFPFTLGRLQSVQDPTSVDYYCYSAGCLAAVAGLSNITTEEAFDMAHSAQIHWNNGTLNRFEVVAHFLDRLVPKEMDEERLSKLFIITSTPSWRGLKAVVRTPKSTEELWHMLEQTTWIPGATGNSLTFDGHLDGAFTTSKHPFCPTVVGLCEFSWDNLDLFTNILNMDLQKEQFTEFLELGKQVGFPL